MSFLSLTIWVVESQAIALPLVSVCSKDSLNFVMKFSKVPRKRVVEAEVKASCWKVDVHVACHILFTLLAISSPLAQLPISSHKLQSILIQTATLDLQTSATFLSLPLHFSLSISILVLASYIALIQCQAVCTAPASEYLVRSPGI